MDERKDTLEIDLGKLISYYLRHWLALLASGLVVALLAFLITKFAITPQYKASVTIYVNNTSSTQGIESITGTNLTAAQQLVNTYVNIIKSDTVLDEVIQKGNLTGTAEDIRRIMTAKQVENTEMFKVSISHPEAKTAAHIANTIAAVAPNRISGFVKGSSTEIIDSAKTPASPYTPNCSKNVVLGALLGCILMGAYLTIRFLFDMRIEDEEDITDYLQIPVLGVIPEHEDGTKKKGRYEMSAVGKGGNNR